MNLFISIIIPVRNAQATLKKCIDSILNLNYRDYEIIIVNDGSIDETGKILSGYQGIKIVTTAGIGPSRARNMAVEFARGEFIAFTDADCIVPEDWLERLIEGFNYAPEAVSCGGRQELPADASGFQKKVFLLMGKIGFATDYMRRGENSIIEVSHNASCCVMYKKDIFLKAGGFLNDLWPGEDVELDYKLKNSGYKLVFNPKAFVFHYRVDNPANFLKMMTRYGWAQGVLVRRHKRIFRKIQVLPLVSAFVLFMLIDLFISGKIKVIILFVFTVFGIILTYLRFNLSILGLGMRGFINWHKGFIEGLFYHKRDIKNEKLA